MQNNPDGNANLALQLNIGVCSSVLLSKEPIQTLDPANQRGVAHAVISALNQSLDTGKLWTVTGSLK